MEMCVSSAPVERSFGDSHRVACHAVTDDGRLRAPTELPLLPSATVLAAAASLGVEVPLDTDIVISDLLGDAGGDDTSGATPTDASAPGGPGP